MSRSIPVRPSASATIFAGSTGLVMIRDDATNDCRAELPEK